jgi:nucleoside-diphosphate-sugar epimerase
MTETANGRSVLITGANGFIGSRLCAMFLKEGFSVFAGVRKTADLSQLEGIAVQYRYGDVTDPSGLPAMVTGMDYVIHNAGIVKAKSAAQFFAVNAEGTRNLLQTVAQNNPTTKRFVLISSMAAVGPSRDGQVLTEETPPNPVTAYGQSKLAGERVCAEYSGKLPITVLRPHGVYGPGDKEAFSFFQIANYRLKPMFGNSQRMIQMVHVDDVCRGVLKGTVTNVKSGSAYAIAEKRAYSLREMVSMLERASGKKGLPLLIPSALFKLIAGVSGAVSRMIGQAPMLTRDKADELLGSWEVSTEKARRELGFESEISFEEGARETFAWYREHGWL